MSHGLAILVADRDIDAAVRGVLARLRSAGHPVPVPAVHTHPQHDPGCYRDCEGLLRIFQREARHALVVFDWHGSGREAESAATIEASVETRLARSGWNGERDAAAIVIEPEVERWVWASDRAMKAGLSWTGPDSPLRQLPEVARFPFGEDAKPTDPKAAFQALLRRARIPRSADLFEQIALRAPIDQCVDRSFVKLLATLRRWYPTA